MTKKHENIPLDESQQGSVLEMPELENQVALNGKKFYIESYGCQMNFNDSEIIASILKGEGYSLTKDFMDADILLLNTCSIREKAEVKIRKRLQDLKIVKKKKKNALFGIMGCMAERLKTELLEQEKLVDIVCGPDSYRDLPQLVSTADTGQKAVNVFLSKEETYANINPVRLDNNGVTSFVSIMRGCDNMCSFCVVPFTRGRERSRNAFSVIAEAQDLFDRGYKEVTLLGQNVDSFKWENPETKEKVTFANLLEMTAQISPDLRIRFSTSHPKDITDDVLYTMKKYDNVCNYIHLPIQSGSSRVLDLMNRGYDREWYINKIETIRRILPDCAISTDIITGFCTETEEDHKDTLSMLDYVQYELAYMFFYSERPGTLAARKYKDDVPLEVKKRRLQEVIDKQRAYALELNKKDIGKVFKVLIEKTSKRSDEHLVGRNDQNKKVIFPKANTEIGQYAYVKVTDCTSATLLGEVVEFVETTE